MSELDFQNWLDVVGDAFFTNAFDVYSDAIALPVSVVTTTNVTVLGDESELRVAFDAWVAMLESTRATHMIRTAQNVQYLNEGLITGTYQTRLVRNSELIMPVFQSSMNLLLSQGSWKAICVVSGLKNSEWPIFTPRVDASANRDPFAKGKVQ